MKKNIYTSTNNFKGLDKRMYLLTLNEIHRHWGDENIFDWTFNNIIGGISTDIITYTDEFGKLIAGSAIVYRMIRFIDGNQYHTGIMTGSWTHPECRGKGFFTKIIHESIQISKKRGAKLLAAYVTQDNASCSRLVQAGASLYSSYYMFGDFKNTPINGEVPHSVEIMTEVDLRFLFSCCKSLFVYTFDEFVEQYINSPYKKYFLRVNNEYVIYTETYNAIKILFTTCKDLTSEIQCIKTLKMWCAKANKKQLFMFTCQPDIFDFCKSEGFNCHPGYLTYIQLDDSIPKINLSGCNIYMADKM